MNVAVGVLAIALAALLAGCTTVHRVRGDSAIILERGDAVIHCNPARCEATYAD